MCIFLGLALVPKEENVNDGFASNLAQQTFFKVTFGIYYESLKKLLRFLSSAQSSSLTHAYCDVNTSSALKPTPLCWLPSVVVTKTSMV